MSTFGHFDTFARDNLPPRSLWPERSFELPELRYPSRLNCAAELLDRRVAAGDGERIALRTREGGCTYRQLLARVNRIAQVLRDDLRLVPGNRILLHGFNHPMTVACWLAAVKAGCVVVATMPLLRAAELRAIVEKARVGVALCDARLLDVMNEVRGATKDLRDIVPYNVDATDSLETMLVGKQDTFVNVDTAADDVALIAFTSGTTGEPKGAMHFHRSVMAMCDAFPRSILHVSAEDVFCGTPPLAFTYGLGGLQCFPLRYGASTVLAERSTPESLLETIQDCRATVCFTAPTYWRRMAALAHDFDLASLRHCVSAGEPLPDATRQLWKAATGLEIVDGLGTTEMLHIFLSHAPQDVRREAIGRAVPGYRVRIVDETGRSMPTGQAGLLAVQGPTGCFYLADEARQREYVREGWNLTGDVGWMDEDGYFHYLARHDDMIVSAGYNIAGPEVEAVLLGHPAVLECGVVGVPDEARGQIVKAFVVLRAGFVPSQVLAGELQDHVKRSIAPYKYPRAVEFVESLPRTGTNKLQHYKLREHQGSMKR